MDKISIKESRKLNSYDSNRMPLCITYEGVPMWVLLTVEQYDRLVALARKDEK